MEISFWGFSGPTIIMSSIFAFRYVSQQLFVTYFRRFQCSLKGRYVEVLDQFSFITIPWYVCLLVEFYVNRVPPAIKRATQALVSSIFLDSGHLKKVFDNGRYYIFSQK